MTQKIYTIAEILHLAADEFLYFSIYDPTFKRNRYSCVAIQKAIYHLYGGGPDNKDIRKSTESRIDRGLRTLGLSTKSLTAFEEFHPSGERQQVRYAWLKFVALLAEEQGV